MQQPLSMILLSGLVAVSAAWATEPAQADAAAGEQSGGPPRVEPELAQAIDRLTRRTKEAPTRPPAEPRRETDFAVKLVELPPEFRSLDTASRRHHAIGFRWTSAESWLRTQGFEVNNCLLPMVRVHTKGHGVSDASAALWIYARCSFR